MTRAGWAIRATTVLATLAGIVGAGIDHPGAARGRWVVVKDCQAVLAYFAWWTVTCDKPATATLEQDGETWHVCAEHFEATQ